MGSQIRPGFKLLCHLQTYDFVPSKQDDDGLENIQLIAIHEYIYARMVFIYIDLTD